VAKTLLADKAYDADSRVIDPLKASGKTNACGFVSIDSLNKANGFSGSDTVRINMTQYSLSGIPVTGFDLQAPH
jgi:hypothetical protein